VDRVRRLELTEPPGRRKGVKLMEVASESRPDRWYAIYREADGGLSCSCPDYLFRRRQVGEECKQLRAVRRQHGLRPIRVPPAQDFFQAAVLPRFLVLDI
jgi:hypothetical protein